MESDPRIPEGWYRSFPSGGISHASVAHRDHVWSVVVDDGGYSAIRLYLRGPGGDEPAVSVEIAGFGGSAEVLDRYPALRRAWAVLSPDAPSEDDVEAALAWCEWALAVASKSEEVSHGPE